jgi:hypothetical protein
VAGAGGKSVLPRPQAHKARRAENCRKTDVQMHKQAPADLPEVRSCGEADMVPIGKRQLITELGSAKISLRYKQ